VDGVTVGVTAAGARPPELGVLGATVAGLEAAAFETVRP
jgi:hypothetical protein